MTTRSVSAVVIGLAGPLAKRLVSAVVIELAGSAGKALGRCCLEPVRGWLARCSSGTGTGVGRLTVGWRPVGELSASSIVLGMADVVVANDPITGQGANAAARCAAIYHQSILARGTQPFDREWMQQTFDAYWGFARHVTELCTMMLGPMPLHLQQILGAAARNPAVAHRFAYGYANPTDFENWLMDPARAEAYLASAARPGYA